MVTLTLQDKKALMEMLRKHYSIDESAFIKAIAQNEEEEVELTLKAFSLAQRTQEAEFAFRIVQIDHLNVGALYNCKSTLIKAMKESTKLGLAECKAIADKIVSFGKDKLLFNPFKIGVSNKVYTFTESQWLALCEYLRNSYGRDAIKWHYV